MVERIAGQDGLAAQGGQERKGWYRWVDPRTGEACLIRDADDFIRGVGSRDEGYYGDSSLHTLRDPAPSRGRHTRGTPLEDSS